MNREITKPAKLEADSSEEKPKNQRDELSPQLNSQPGPPLRPQLSPEDFYYEGPYMVFTAAYHLKRGYCCNSNCRHCPYK